MLPQLLVARPCRHATVIITTLTTQPLSHPPQSWQRQRRTQTTTCLHLLLLILLMILLLLCLVCLVCLLGLLLRAHVLFGHGVHLEQLSILAQALHLAVRELGEGISWCSIW